MTGHQVVMADWFKEQLAFPWCYIGPSDARLDDLQSTVAAKDYSNLKVGIATPFLYHDPIATKVPCFDIANKLQTFVNGGVARNDPAQEGAVRSCRSRRVDDGERRDICRAVAKLQASRAYHTYIIENAFGIQYPMTLSRKNGNLWAIAHNATCIAGKTSAIFAFGNGSTSMLSLLFQNGTIESPLYNTYEAVLREIGPFGSIDMKIVPCPAVVQAVVAAGLRRTALTAASLSTVLADCANLAASEFQSRSTSYGGRVLCTEVVAGATWRS
ncbi:hypothetical protein H310_14802 [Aphanomyces invadans]|uniref:Uncharacterized protein n=1 Tax=Aphanomyces invadans TaxID=157072 RepID=A0A024T9Z6_9STRA|nr:hypothetical protein H310_14802 [Aphanomyces invadans]ETV90416.1 hypothetical protein H310_14802 [Aphanomyces invadans]|eukprot:XP_008880955.1 hypothetical protein H310_14802 [Aphanomyces invadans]